MPTHRWRPVLWWMLRWLGHEAVAVLDGGFKAWLAAGGAVESGEAAGPDRAHARFTPRVDPRAVLSTAGRSSAPCKPAPHLLVDARAAERFAGSVEPIDPVAGHVPGAVNHPFTANLGADGRFLPAAELERRWRERLAGRCTCRHVIAMCGSGVTACHHLLSLEAAGLPGGRLYAGSWSEWIRDPRRARRPRLARIRAHSHLHAAPICYRARDMNTPAKVAARQTPGRSNESLDLYQVEAWGKGYFSINDAGHVVDPAEHGRRAAKSISTRWCRA